MDIAPLHRWPNSPRAAVALQKRLATDICQTPLSRKVQWIGGADAAFSPDGRYVIAAALVWHLPTRSLLESHVVVAPLKFPYVPGLLSFREAPALLRAFAKLEKIPDVVLCDGQGLAHP
ncbi:MAG: endonuclease V, partial [Phycisphaerae bacterium]